MVALPLFKENCPFSFFSSIEENAEKRRSTAGTTLAMNLTLSRPKTNQMIDFNASCLLPSLDVQFQSPTTLSLSLSLSLSHTHTHTHTRTHARTHTHTHTHTHTRTYTLTHTACPRMFIHACALHMIGTSYLCHFNQYWS